MPTWICNDADPARVETASSPWHGRVNTYRAPKEKPSMAEEPIVLEIFTDYV
jgi:hypothetical protein